MALSILTLLTALHSEANAANEQRCNQLGANCFCSEPMNTSTWTVSNGAFFNPADTTSSDKQCNTSGLSSYFLEAGSGFSNYRTINSGEAMNALPAGRTLTYVLATLEGRGGGFAGAKMRSSDGVPTARRAARWYIYYSPNFVWGSGGTDSGGGTCNNSNKMFQVGWNGAGTGGPMVNNTYGNWSFYDINTAFKWNQSADCCMDAPGADAGAPRNLASFLGKWWRVEFVMHNAATTGAVTYWQVYAKNVTDNGPEYKVMDSSVAQTGISNTWGGSLITNLHPTSEMTDYSINMFRNSLSGGTCRGYFAFSHYLAAAWNTDAGQRIGAAVEIEGGSGSNQRPSAPQNLTVSMLMESQQ